MDKCEGCPVGEELHPWTRYGCGDCGRRICGLTPELQRIVKAMMAGELGDPIYHKDHICLQWLAELSDGGCFDIAHGKGER